MWSPQAEELFGYAAPEALGQYAARLMVHERQMGLVGKLFADVMRTGRSWAGGFPVRHKDGTTRLVEFRTMRLLDDRGDVYALGLAADQSTVRRLEQDVALSERMVKQSPIGYAVLDSELRFVSVSPALERINGLPAAEHVGRTLREVLPRVDAGELEAAAPAGAGDGHPADRRDARRPYGGRPGPGPHLVALAVPAGGPHGQRARGGGLDGRHHRAAPGVRGGEGPARHRLAVIADASAPDRHDASNWERTACELAESPCRSWRTSPPWTCWTRWSRGRQSTLGPAEPAVIRALAVRPAEGTDAVLGRRPAGPDRPVRTDRLVTECVRTGERAVLVPHVKDEDLPHIARSAEAAVLLGRAGLHSYLAVPLIARGEVLGALDLKRTRNPAPFDEDDLLLARELAARAAVQIDNAAGTRTPATPPSPCSAACCPVIRR